MIYGRDKNNPKITKFYRSFLSKEEPLCFDVGANIGRVTDILLCLGARVIAVEPNPECVRYLRKKYRFNRKVDIIPQALDTSVGKKKLYMCEVNSLSTVAPDWIKACKESKRYSEFDWNREVEVEVTTLDNLIKKYGLPDYVKIDVEGNEHNVLKGLNQKVHMVSLELCPETVSSTQNYLKHLNDLGNNNFNFSSGETAEKFDLPEWISAIEVSTLLKNNPRYGYLWSRSVP
ncbi:MAG TPA: FkbM family methyltransferase [Candidatus Omnitrophota bacterium]|nr:FkbM family methyltransferase [Candidatus Omnitrophota bacterium]